MPRPLVSQIYAYLICVIAILVALASLAGFVKSAFRVAHPTFAGGPLITERHFGFGGRYGRGMRAPELPPLPPPGAPGVRTFRVAGPPVELQQRFIADARYAAVGKLVTNLVLLLAAIALFLWHWRWLHGAQLRQST